MNMKRLWIRSIFIGFAFAASACSRDRSGDAVSKAVGAKAANSEISQSEAVVASRQSDEGYKLLENHKKASDENDLIRRIKNGQGDHALDAKKSMEAFLDGWNPIGRTVDELKGKLGQPSLEGDAQIKYIFDSGLYGWVFNFHVVNGKVAQTEHYAY